MEAVNIIGSAWYKDEDFKMILARMEAEENEQVVDNSGGSPCKVTSRRKTEGDVKSIKEVSTEADDDISDDDDEPSGEDPTSSPK